MSEKASRQHPLRLALLLFKLLSESSSLKNKVSNHPQSHLLEVKEEAEEIVRTDRLMPDCEAKNKFGSNQREREMVRRGLGGGGVLVG